MEYKYPKPSERAFITSREIDTHRVKLDPLRPPPNIKISTPEDVVKFVQEMSDYDRERMKILHLDTKNRVIGVETIAEGTLNQAMISVREAIKGAVLNNAAGVLILHNHPSGSSQPSHEDDMVISKLIDAFNMMGLDVVDSIIVSKEGKGYYSYKEAGRMPGKGIGGIESVMETDKEQKEREICSIAMEAAMSVVREQCGEGTELDTGVMVPPPREVMMVREDKELSQEEKIEEVEKSLWARRLSEGWVKAVMSYLKPGTEEYDRAVESMAHKVAVGLVTKAG